MNAVCIAQSDTIKKAEKVKPKDSIDMTERKGIIFGAHLSRFPTLEIGYSKYFHLPDNSKIPVSGGYAISIENYFLNNYIMAPKVSYWTSVICINFGASVPWYTDLNGRSSLKLRPELGIGDKKWRINMAYNLPVYNHKLKSITDFMISFNYIVPFKKDK